MSHTTHAKHDKVIRTLMSYIGVPADFMRHYFPAQVQQLLDLDTLALCKESFVGARQAAYYADMLYSVSLKGGKPGFVYILFEHKSYRDRFTALQLLRYMLEIWELYRKQNRKAKTLPMVIPAVLYHGKSRGKAIRLAELIDIPHAGMRCYIPDFALNFYDFSPKANTAIKGDIFLQLMLKSLVAKNLPQDADRLSDIIQHLAQLDDSEISRQWLEVILRYVTQAMDVERAVVKDLMDENFKHWKGETAMSIAQQWVQEGRAEGIMLGEARGEARGRHTLLTRQLTRKFGREALTPAIQQRLQSATPDQLDYWGERILDVQRLDEVFREN